MNKINVSLRKLERDQERNERKLILIISNLPEDQRTDLAKVEDLVFNKMKCVIIDIRIQKIGKKIEGKDRLLCVRLGSLRDKINILKWGGPLHGQDGGVVITEDLTREDRIRKKELLKEMYKIREKGKFARMSDHANAFFNEPLVTTCTYILHTVDYNYYLQLVTHR